MEKSDLVKFIPGFLLNSKIYSITVIDFEGIYIYVNGLFKERFSFLKSHFVGDPVSIAIHQDDLPKYIQVVQLCLLNPSQSFPIQIREPSEVENEFYLTQWELSLFQDNHQMPVGIVCVGYEVRVEEKTNQKLAQTETLLKAMYDSTSDACTFINHNFEFLFLNQLAKDNCKLVFNREPALGDLCLDFFHPHHHETFINYFHQVLNGESIKSEMEDGGIWWLFSLFPVYDSIQNIVGIAISVRDITIRKENEIRIIKQNERLKQITWQHSHEVRRHIVNILGLHELIKNKNLLSNDEKQMQLDELLNEIKNLDQVVHAIVNRSVGEV